jgi:Tfp pilus assembly protein PilF
MSSPTDSTPSQATPRPRTTAPKPKSFRLNPRRMMLLLLLILVGPCVVVQAPLEVGRWKYAAAVEAREQGDKAAAYRQLEETMRWIPNSRQLFARRAQWRLADGQQEQALADAERVMQLSGESAEACRAYGRFLQRAGQFREAVAYWKKVDQQSQLSGKPSRSQALNELAYAQALAKVDLDDALRSVEESLQLITPQEEQETSARGAALDTRGYLLYLKGRYNTALADLNRAIQLTEVPLLKERLAFERLPEKVRKQHGPPSKLESLAVLYYHRALIHEALGNEPAANADRARAKVLIGREPDDSLF